MAKESRIFVCFSLLIVTTEALKLPDYIKPCSRSDPNFNDCALKKGREAFPRIVRGDRNLGVPVLDPLFVERLSMKHAGMQATSINFTIEGMKDAELESFSADFDRQVIQLSFKVPRLMLSGWYNVRGKILGMSMYGDGDYVMDFNELRGNYSTNYTLRELADGEQYAVPDAYDVEYNMDEMKVNFGNLFNGNKLLGNALNNLINQNWRIVVEDLGKPVFMALGGIVHRILTTVSQKIPYNELFTK